MLRVMRKKAQSWMIKALFGIIIIVFVFFYGYGRRSGRRTIIAEVNGTKITDSLFISEYRKAYQNVARLYQSIYGDQFDEAMIDRLALRQRVLEGLIDETLVAQEAEKLSLRLSPQELQTAVHSNPAFQVGGQFSQERFTAFLRANQMNVEEFEEMEKRNRLITKLTDLIGLGGVEVSDQEILDAYTLENEKINLEFARFNPTDYEKSISVDDQELNAYFAENSGLFEIPPKVQVQYLVFAIDDFLKTVEVSPEEVQEEYEYNREDYRIPKRVNVSHILIKGNGDNGEKGVEEARKKAEEILDQAKAGEDFASLAKKYSEDESSAQKGGSIGWVREGEVVSEYVDVAFSLDKGEISQLVETDEGFHIVKVTDVEEERIETLSEVEGKIREQITRTKSRELAEEACHTAFFAVFESKSLDDYAAKKGKTVKTTGLFSRDERLKEVGGNMEFNNHAFSQEEGEILSPLEIGDKYYLMKVLKKENSRIPELEEVKEEVRREYLEEKNREKAESAAEEMLQELKAGKSLAESASARGLKVEETGFFERGGNYVPKLGPAAALGKEIFSVSGANPLVERVASYGNFFFVMKLKAEEKIDLEKFESEKAQYRKRLYADKTNQILRRWLKSLREKSEIKIREENLRI